MAQGHQRAARPRLPALSAECGVQFDLDVRLKEAWTAARN